MRRARRARLVEPRGRAVAVGGTLGVTLGVTMGGDMAVTRAAGGAEGGKGGGGLAEPAACD